MDTAVAMLIALLNQAGTISSIVARMREEGRDKLTDEEWASVLDRDDVARAAQMAALERAKP